VEGSPVRVIAPLIDMKKSDIVRLGKERGAPYELTWSCYKGGEKACGVCDSCILRLNGFRDAGMEDPLEYENQ
jgi:7-cyano-7-deazaguanine synthase